MAGGRGEVEEAALVGVVIPAHNAAETLPATLGSLTRQTLSAWHAVIIDDGSTDETARVAEEIAAGDRRFSIVRQERAGAAAARNRGIAAVRGEWLLFLDADDLLASRALERLTRAGGPPPGSEVVLCGWERVSAHAVGVELHPPDDPARLFEILARRCGLAIHSCLVRRSLVEEVGGFDPELTTCEEWDLWQRIARSTDRITTIPDALATYRARPGSLSRDPARLVRDGLTVIARAHAPDPRVSRPLALFRDGWPAADRAAAQAEWLCWPVGMAIAQGDDPRPLLSTLADEGPISVSPGAVGDMLLAGLLATGLVGADDLAARWEFWQSRLQEVLSALEERTGTTGLAIRATRTLERRIASETQLALPARIGETLVVEHSLSAPPRDLQAPERVTRLHLRLRGDSGRLAPVELPVCGPLVPADVVADAIAARHAWVLLRGWLEEAVYPDLEGEPAEGGTRLYRAGTPLAAGLPTDQLMGEALHDHIGWCVFLQELWGAPGDQAADFYDPDASLGEVGAAVTTVDGWIEIEVSEALPERALGPDPVRAAVLVGGAGVAVVPVRTDGAGASAGAIRAAICSALGFELCVAAVREAILRGAGIGASLRGRLATLAARRRNGRHAAMPAPPGVEPAPNWARAVRDASSGVSMVILSRADAAIGSAASRTAVLPADASLRGLAEFDQPVLPMLDPPSSAPVRYAPGVLWEPAGGPPESSDEGAPADQPHRAGADRHYFETLFALRPDPWRYTTGYERVKYEQTLALVPRGRRARALEVACAEGHFTEMLAPRVRALTALDISQVALTRAAARCAHLANVSFIRADPFRERLPGEFDLVVCSEVLYFFPDLAGLDQATEALGRAVAPGGSLIVAHANLLADEPERPGFAWGLPYGSKTIGASIATAGRLDLAHELHTPYYRIQRFERRGGRFARRRRPRLREAQAALDVGAYIRSGFRPAGSPVAAPQPDPPITTSRLPILMYHRVTDAPIPSGLERWRVRPAALDEQLCYLRETGFRSVTLDEWRSAAQARRPLAGRAVVLTFDDGYRDFFTDAWPLLERYGFGADVFLPTGHVGGRNGWDAGFDSSAPLMGWDEIRALSARGIRFGSHTASHAPLTALAPAEIVAELVGSRVEIQRRIKRSVTTLAYPWGDTDDSVAHVVGACGYAHGLTTRAARAVAADDMLALPRIEIRAEDELADFVAKLSLHQPVHGASG